MMSESFNGWERWCKRLTADTPPTIDEAMEFCLFARQWLPTLLMRAAIRPSLVPTSPQRHGSSEPMKAAPGLQDIAELLRDRAEALSAERPDMARLMWQGAKTLDALIHAIVQKAPAGEDQPLLHTLARSLPVVAESFARDDGRASLRVQEGPDEEKVYLRQKVDSLVSTLTEQAALHGGLAEKAKLAETRAKAAEAEVKRLHKTLASLQLSPTAEPSGEIVASLRDALGLLKDERKKRDKGEERERALRDALEEARIAQAARATPALHLEALAQLPRSAVAHLPAPAPAQPAPTLRSSAPISYPETETRPVVFSAPRQPTPAEPRPASPPLPAITPRSAASIEPSNEPSAPARRIVREAPEPAAPGQRAMRSSDQLVAAYRAQRAANRPAPPSATSVDAPNGKKVPAAPTPHASAAPLQRSPMPAPAPAPSEARPPINDNGTRIQFITSDDF
ncbi:MULTISPECIES: hypothetical protein [unclassified Chelatococcus]|uniref:hypothetical protein n=1 Tax=unclassified Chelatococcus TaxID=2638111 RepID=UPI001BCC38C8|nr:MULTISPECIES: hypothetical protein [unclassified Chelatococcus]MBS7696473.1 hypothetical protein [Chelatococcus sp. YT9]MBX3555039.1 hypothetical protein [Chelatococcus sp.]